MAVDATDTAARPARSVLVGMAVLAVLFVVVSVGLSRVVGRPEGVEHRVVIPAGTAQRLAGGEDVALLPADLRFRLRDQLVVVNNDSATHQVGPFLVASGESLHKRFSEAVTLEGFCSLHPSGRITIEIGGT